MEFKKTVLKKLVDLDKNQKWLLSEIHEKTGLYCDNSYLSKILSGQRAAPKIVSAIKEILDLKEET
jgi:hypothetical protein